MSDRTSDRALPWALALLAVAWVASLPKEIWS